MRLPRLLVLLLALSSFGCASTVLPGSGSKNDIEILKERVLELQKQARVNEVEIEDLRSQIAALEARLGDTGKARDDMRPGSASAPSRAGAEATRPRRNLEPPPPAQDRTLPIESDEGSIDEVDLASPSPPLESAEPPPRPPTAGSRPAATTAAGGGGSPTGGSATLSAAGQALYDRGYTLYHQGRFVDAEASFQRFLQAHGATDLADNAQYWIGEARYARGDLRGALAAFQETVERFPKGNKVADSLLKAGQSLEGLRDLEGARASYSEVRRRYPNTAAAAVAEERLARLQ